MESPAKSKGLKKFHCKFENAVVKTPSQELAPVAVALSATNIH